ncbi:hypothetical protein [Streptomyces sp. NPDC004629]
MRRAGDILDRSSSGSVAEPRDGLWAMYVPAGADRMLNVNCSIVNW